jgi:hypothetical protein
VDVRRAADRFVTRTDWLESAHSFSFGPYFDPANTSHGALVVNNDDVVGPGGGFETHRHADMEIVTWVLSGSLAHEDSAGHRGVVTPGEAQRMSAGSGVLHSERNAAARSSQEPVHFVQMWVLPDEPGGPPAYQQRDVGAEVSGGALVPVVSGLPAHAETAVALGNSQSAFSVARLGKAGSVRLPEAPSVHAFLARGAVDVEGIGALAAGDAVRLTRSGGQRVTATAAAELLVWEMHGRTGA